MQTPTARELLAGALPRIADGMVEAARQHKATGIPCRIDESVLKVQAKAALAAPAGAAGLRIEPQERTIRPEDWPRVGRVDLVVSPSTTAATRPVPTHAFVELKWGFKDALWNCIWDVAKSALVHLLGLAEHALLLGGFSDEREWQHPKYARLMTSRRWTAGEFQRLYASDWRYWARPPTPAETDRTGPYRLPREFSTELVARHGFRFEGAAWSLGLVAVTTAGADCIDLDERALPLAPPGD
jgi:hypothetical protein